HGDKHAGGRGTSTGWRHVDNHGDGGAGDVLDDEPHRRVEAAGCIETNDQGLPLAFLRRGECIMQVFCGDRIDDPVIRGEEDKRFGSYRRRPCEQGMKKYGSRDSQKRQTGTTSRNTHRSVPPTRLRYRETERLD